DRAAGEPGVLVTEVPPKRERGPALAVGPARNAPRSGGDLDGRPRHAVANPQLARLPLPAPPAGARRAIPEVGLRDPRVVLDAPLLDRGEQDRVLAREHHPRRFRAQRAVQVCVPALLATSEQRRDVLEDLAILGWHQRE